MSKGEFQTWMDQESSWWAKANRAKEHIDSLRRQVDAYRASAPYSLTPEPTDKPGRLAYRLSLRFNLVGLFALLRLLRAACSDQAAPP